MNRRIIPVTKPEEVSDEEWTRLQELARKQVKDAFRHRDTELLSRILE